MKFQWDEPASFTRDYLQSTGTLPTQRRRLWTGVIAAAAVECLILGFQGLFLMLHHKDPEVPLSTHVVGPVLAGFVVYFLPTMVIAARCTIVLTEKGIHRNKALGSKLIVQLWPWDSISEIAVEDIRLGESVHRILVIRSSLEQGEILVGLGDTPVNRIKEFIDFIGKTLINREVQMGQH